MEGKPDTPLPPTALRFQCNRQYEVMSRVAAEGAGMAGDQHEEAAEVLEPSHDANHEGLVSTTRFQLRSDSSQAPESSTNLDPLQKDASGSFGQPAKNSAEASVNSEIPSDLPFTASNLSYEEVQLWNVNWSHVLKHLQREKKKALAQQEEHYVNRSLFCLESSSLIREKLIVLTEWPWFNRFILFIILLNCVLLVIDNPVCSCQGNVCLEYEIYSRIVYTRLGSCSDWNKIQNVLQVFEYLFTALFTAEMVIKIVARGLVPGLIQNVTVLRTARILRPLRTMTRIKGMKPLMKTVISSLRSLTNVVLLLIFVMTVFGILAIELAAGNLRGRCYIDPTPGANTFSASAWTLLISQQKPFIAEPNDLIGSYNAGITFCVPGVTDCGQFAIDGVYYNTTCSFYRWCFTDWCTDWNNNPYYEGGAWLSFDNFLLSLMVLWETLTLEGWTTDLLYNYQEGWGNWPARIYFCSFLALAVLSDAYLQALEEERSEREMEALHHEAILKPEKDIIKRVARRKSSWVSDYVAVIQTQSKSWLKAIGLGERRRRCEIDPTIPANASSHCQGPLYNRSWDTDGQGGGQKLDQSTFCFMERDSEFWPDQQGCSQYNNEGDCNQAVVSHGVGCVFFPDKGVNGTCMLALYNAYTFVHQEDLIYPDRTQRLGMRHMCGDSLNECPSFPTTLNFVLDQTNFALTLVFVSEMVLKWIGLGFKEYFADAYNRFDFLVVFGSIFELILGAVNTSSNGSTLSALRGLRMLRLLKLAQSWEEMRKIISSLFRALSSLGPLTIFWVMFMYIFALLSMQSFGGKFHYVKTDVPRSNFDTFGPSALGHGAFFIVFQIISTENWNTVMYNSMTANDSANPWNAWLTICIVAFGNYIIMNLFISILLQGFGEADNEEKPHGSNQPSLASKMARGFKDILHRLRRRSKTLPILDRRLTEPGTQTHLTILNGKNGEFQTSDQPNPEDFEDPEWVVEVKLFGRSKKLKIANHRSFLVFKRKNLLRVVVANIVQNPVFDTFILSCILATSITLLIERPDSSFFAEACPMPPAVLNCTGPAAVSGQTANINCPRSVGAPNFGKVWDPCDATSGDIPDCCYISQRVQILGLLDEIFTLIFFSEMIMKMFVDGLIFHEYAYLRNSWNVLDCLVVIISMMSSFGGSANAKSFKVLRALRALRPLRVIKRNKSLRVAVVCLLSSIPAMLNVLVVVLFWFVIYAMLGVQFFRGKLYRCVNEGAQTFLGTTFFPLANTYTVAPLMAGNTAVPSIVDCVAAGTEGQQASSPGVWLNKNYSFDNLAQALSTLFQMSTTEGWMDVMFVAVDVVAPGITPIPNENPWFALYCVLHIILGAFVLLNLIVAEVIKNYVRIKGANDGITPFITPEQQEWREMRRIIFSMKPIKRITGPKNKFRNFFFRLLPALKLLQLLRTYNQDASTIKLIGLGHRWYFSDPWNNLDFLVVLISVVTISLEFLRGDFSCYVNGAVQLKFPGLKPLRALRIARADERDQTVADSSGWFQCSDYRQVVGVNFFYNINVGQDPYGRMTDLASYQTIDSAIFLLFRQTTGEAWNGIITQVIRDLHIPVENDQIKYYDTFSACVKRVLAIDTSDEDVEDVPLAQDIQRTGSDKSMVTNPEPVRWERRRRI
eukprot:758314-Hanusia_phi.AAC.5